MVVEVRKLEYVNSGISARFADQSAGTDNSLAERVARIEGAMSGPWRPPANGASAPASTPPEAAA